MPTSFDLHPFKIFGQYTCDCCREVFGHRDGVTTYYSGQASSYGEYGICPDCYTAGKGALFQQLELFSKEPA